MNREYEVSGAKLAIFTYEGAKIQLRGRCAVEYVSEETCMHAYLNTHLALEEMRQEAAHRLAEAPRVIIMGQSRNTISRILLNYAIRAGRTPIYADLDPSGGNLTVPGSIGAQILDKPVDVTGEPLMSEGTPIIYFNGNASWHDPQGQPSKLFRRLATRLAFAVNGKLASLEENDKSGAIICMPPDSEELVAEVRDLFKVNLVLVVGNERLYITVNKALTGSGENESNSDRQKTTTVLKLPKSGGVVAKDTAWRKLHQQSCFQRYFYGNKKEYSPFSLVLSFDDVDIRRLGEDMLAPKSALPLGATRRLDESQAQKVEPTAATLLYSILAVSWAPTETQIADCNVAGFVYVTGVDEAKRQLTILTICPGKLPSRFLLLGNLKWIEK